MGRFSATAQMAHLICELFLRLKVDRARRRRYDPIPMTQAELGDTLGLSTVHVNRVLQELRKEGLIRCQGDALTILDWERLKRWVSSPRPISAFSTSTARTGTDR